MPPKTSAPTTMTDSLPSTTLIPTSPLLRRFIQRLPKATIIDLILIWLDHPLCPIHPPLDDDEDEYLMQDDETLDDRKAVYEEYRVDNDIPKRVVVDRILGNDWVGPSFIFTMLTFVFREGA